MIEWIVSDRCTGCNQCVAVCPTNVLEAASDGPPRIARQEDCQTCFMCELYCQEDAIFVGADCESAQPVDRQAVLAQGLLGQFRRDSGWDEWASDPRYANEHWRMDRVFLLARALASAQQTG
ncbi:Photosystem I iron-sulfur center [Andreprevotia sp. IGB-42]|uniref:4Fe-4S dicluster domain-containing protein n=1 Tax=Andreprevotia sp. IGB-42 TaxID=2497473 RepID=UPI001357D451|nr:ferredoxin family protein [Andreprevotia sp. IGB-42]KAF0812655.1 Photosystem I iron-sulfur center [Andreprevotia sp. IGB-42]